MSARSLSTQHQQVIRYTVLVQENCTSTMSTRTCTSSRYKFRTRTSTSIVLYCKYSLVRVRVQDLEDLKLLCLLVLYSYCTSTRTCRPTAYSVNLSLQSRGAPTHPPFTGLYANTRPDTSRVRAGHVTPAWQGLNNPEPIILHFIILIPIS